MATNNNQPIVLSDEIHIGKKTLVKYISGYIDYSTMTDEEKKYIINEDTSLTRFNKLYNECLEALTSAYQTYMKYWKGKQIKFGDIPYYDKDSYEYIEYPLQCSEIEHCFGLPYKNRIVSGDNDDYSIELVPETEKLVKDLYEAYKESNKNKKLKKQTELTDYESYFLNNVDGLIDKYIDNNTKSESFNIVIENIYERLEELYKNHKDDIEINKDLLFQVKNIRETLFLNNTTRFKNDNNLKKYFETTFIDETSKSIIKMIAKDFNNINILRLSNSSDKENNNLIRHIRKNLSSYEIVPKKKDLVSYLSKNEKKIKKRVLEELSNKYIKDVISDDNILNIINDKLIPLTDTGELELDRAFVKDNMQKDKAQVKNYRTDSLEALIKAYKKGESLEKITELEFQIGLMWDELIKYPNELNNREEVKININNYIDIINDLDYLINNGAENSIENIMELTGIQSKEIEILRSKEHQVELGRCCISKEIENNITIELNQLLSNQRTIKEADLKNPKISIFKELLLDDDKKPVKELSKELNGGSYLNLEQKITNFEMSLRKKIFELESMDKDKTFDDIYKDNDIVDLIFFMLDNNKVRDKAFDIYNSGDYSINYKKCADKSKVMSELTMQNPQMLVMRVKENVKFTNDGREIKPKDDYLTNDYPTTNGFGVNNLYAIVNPVTPTHANVVYAAADPFTKALKFCNTLSNIPMPNDKIVAYVKNNRNFLPTLDLSNETKAIITSSEYFDITMKENVIDTEYNTLKKEHEERFNKFNNLKAFKMDLGEDTKYLTPKRDIYKKIPLDNIKDAEITEMFKPTIEYDFNNKKI